MELNESINVTENPNNNSLSKNQLPSKKQDHVVFQSPSAGDEPINKYNDLIPRKLMEAITGAPIHTIIKYESEGLITPIKTKAGALDVVCYRIKDVQAVLKKRGISFKKKDTAEVIAVWSQKGGTGKTATVQHISSLLSIFGKTLVIDIDSQADATSMLGLNVKYGDVVDEDAELDPTIAELIDWNLEDGYESAYQHLPLERVVKKITPTLHVIPSDLDLAEINYTINNYPIKNEFDENNNLVSIGKITLIKKLIDKIKGQYDFIIFDCPPSIETIVVNALLAANKIIIPVELEAKSLSIMKRNSLFLNRLKNTEVNGHPVGFNFEKVLIVPNKFKRENIKAKALFMLQDLYGSGNRGIEISQIHLPNSAIIDKCSEAQEPAYLSATRYGKEFKSNVKAGKEFTNYFWVIIHEILDIPIDRIPFPNEEDSDASQEA